LVLIKAPENCKSLMWELCGVQGKGRSEVPRAGDYSPFTQLATILTKFSCPVEHLFVRRARENFCVRS
jgi:hypothetical protein